MKHITFFLLSFILLISTVTAAEDFTFSTPENLELCPCSNQAFPITIHNTGTEVSTYTVYATGQAADWTRFQPSTLTLNPNEITTVFAFVNSVCNIAGSSSMDIFVGTDTLTRKLTQSLVINECYDYSVTFGNEIAEAVDSVDFEVNIDDYVLCKDQELIIPLLIENKEQFANRYTILLDAPEWATLDTSSAQLQANSAGVGLISIDTTEVEGEFTFQISAISELGNVQRKVEKEVLVDNCLSFGVDIVPDTVSVCDGSTELVAVELNNGAAITQEVELSLVGESLARIQNSSFSVGPNEVVETTLFVFTQDEANFDVTLLASAETIGQEYTDTVAVEVIPAESCYLVDIAVPKKVRNSYEQDVFSAIVVGQGIGKNTYQVSLDGPVWSSVVPRTLELDEGDEGNLNIAVNPGADVEAGTYELILNIESNGQTYSETIEVVVKEGSFVSSLVGTIAFYQYYFYAALIIILIIFVIVFFFMKMKRTDEFDDEKPIIIEKPKKKEAKIVPKKTAKKKPNKKKSKKKKGESFLSKKVISWIVGALLLLFVVLVVAFVEPVRTLFSLYAVYLVIGIVILVAVILAIRFTPLSKFFK